MQQKLFNTQTNIGKVKYIINTYNGIDKHKDGSKFWGVYTFKSKEKLGKKIKELIKEGYIETNN